MVGLTGCSSISGGSTKGDVAAMTTAKATHRQLLELKKQVRQKQDAERKFYQARIKSFDDALEVEVFANQKQAMLDKARDDAKALINNQGQADRVMLESQIVAAANDMVASLDAATELRKKQREEMAKALAALDNLDEVYGALEKSLVQLSTPTEDPAKLAAFIIKTGKEFEKLQNQAKQSDTKPTN